MSKTDSPLPLEDLMLLALKLNAALKREPNKEIRMAAERAIRQGLCRSCYRVEDRYEVCWNCCETGG